MENTLDMVKSTIEGYFDEMNILDSFRDDFSFGKMLRSKLILAIAPDSVNSVKLCSIIELIHFASLLHDDVIDNSIIRRGKSSINAKYGDKNAIMLGDLMYSKAFYEVSCINMELSKVVSDAVLKLSIGELEDVLLCENINLDSTKYITMIEHKTGALIEASAICAGLLIGEKSDKYKVYGNSLGIAFQIIDDLLDVTQEDSILGKSAFSDFKEGKTTLPYIYLYNSMSDSERLVLAGYFKKELDSAQKRWIVDKMNEYDIVKKTKEVAIGYGNDALKVLSDDDVILRKILQDMIYREF